MKLMFLAGLILVGAVFTGTMQAEEVTIKLGTIAPLRSPWVDELKKLDLEWRKITQGQVKIKIYAGGIAGSEEDMIRKMRMGTLGGAVFTNNGIINIDKEFYVFNIPFFIDSEAQLDYVISKITPIFENNIEKKGFKLITWSKAGWVNFFSKGPVVYPDDMKKHKLSFATGTPEMEEAWKKAGFRIVPNELKDLMMALESGMVDSFYLPPIVAASGQYFALAPYMCTIKIAPVVGGMVCSKKIWDSIPDQYKDKMLSVADKMVHNLYLKTLDLEKEAIEEMKKHGLKIVIIPSDALEKWKVVVDKGTDALMGKAFSKEIYDKAVQSINEYNKSNEKK